MEKWPSDAQAILIDYLYTGNAFHYFLGTYGIDGQRIVIDFCQPPEFVSFSITPGNLTISPEEPMIFDDFENNAELWIFLEERKDSPVSFRLEFSQMAVELSDEDIQYIKENGGDPEFFQLLSSFINNQEQLEYHRDIWFLINKSNFDPRFQMGTEVYQTDSVMSVIYFDASNPMDADDLAVIESEPPIGYTNLLFRQ